MWPTLCLRPGFQSARLAATLSGKVEKQASTSHGTTRGVSPKVCVLAPGEIFGGAERQILALAEWLRSDGAFQPVFALFHERELAARVRQLGMDVHVLGDRGVIDMQSLRRLHRILREEDCNLFSVHGYRAACYLAAAAGSRQLRVVKTEHGRPELTGAGWLRRAKSRFVRALENAAARRLSATIVYVSHDLSRQCLSEHRGLQTHVIYNGIRPIRALSIGRPAEFDLPVMPLVFVGRLEPVKGAATAVAAMAQSSIPNNAHLFIIGTGPEEQKLLALAESLGVTERVSFLGFRENVYDYIAHATALVMPSFHEGLPYALLEALALGTPVVASAVGGLAEVLEDRQTARLIDAGDPAALADAVSWILGSSAEAHAMTKRGRSLVATRFSAETMSRQYASIFSRDAPSP